MFPHNPHAAELADNLSEERPVGYKTVLNSGLSIPLASIIDYICDTNSVSIS